MIISSSIPIYRCDVAYFLESTVEELDEFYKKNRHNMDKDDYDTIKENIEKVNEVGGAVYTCGVNYIVYIRNTNKKGHIDHELWHLTNSVLMDRGVEHTKCDEPYAYLNEYLHDEFRDILRQFKKALKDEKARRTSGDGSGANTEGEKSEG